MSTSDNDEVFTTWTNEIARQQRLGRLPLRRAGRFVRAHVSLGHAGAVRQAAATS